MKNTYLIKVLTKFQQKATYLRRHWSLTSDKLHLYEVHALYLPLRRVKLHVRELTVAYGLALVYVCLMEDFFKIRSI